MSIYHTQGFQAWASEAWASEGRPADEIRRLDTYANAGEWATCERGHRMARFCRSVHIGEAFDPQALVDWQQPEPQPDRPAPPCDCGALFIKDKILHVGGAWRYAGSALYDKARADVNRSIQQHINEHLNRTLRGDYTAAEVEAMRTQAIQMEKLRGRRAGAPARCICGNVIRGGFHKPGCPKYGETVV